MTDRAVHDAALRVPPRARRNLIAGTSEAWVHIHLRGLVQGVGFRPLVYALAREAGYAGRVANGPDGVHIHLKASRHDAAYFLDRLLDALPAYAHVTSVDMADAPPQAWTDFLISESTVSDTPELIIPPDRNLCPDCRRELKDPADRRFGYAFTTCLRCGPRYSIITALPYDRERSAMRPYTMCRTCAAEYADPRDRHHHAQTNSCPGCRIPMQWYDAAGTDMCLDQEAILLAAANALSHGEIIAVKGLGGFLLVADARRPDVVGKLRMRKHRPAKPFALMYPDVRSIEGDAFVSASERQALESTEGPIVLLRLRPHPASGLAAEAIAPGLKRIGAMVPGTALLELLMQAFPHPVIATSGNISGSPILYRDKEAIEGLCGVADHVLGYAREIVSPQDDSVVQYAMPSDTRPIVLRRSRGMAPAFYPNPIPVKPTTALALGAHMKGALAIAARGHLHVSPWLGNLECYEAQTCYRRVLDHMLGLLDVRPDVVLADRHPGYFTTRLGEELASTWKVPLRTYSHHEAHFAAVLAENGLMDATEPVLGVIWDGTGLGDDGHSWGGEFFLRRDRQVVRQAHFDYVPVILGDKMATEPRLSALSFCKDLPEANACLKHKFSPAEWTLYNRKTNAPGIMTSSAGRLFDAVASLLDVVDRQSYEGEAAMRLEALAWEAPQVEAYPLEGMRATGPVSMRDVLTFILADIRRGRSRAEIAAAFHRTLVAVIARVARQANVRRIALGGGVWQNALLNALADEHLGGEFELVRHARLSPNDECIPVGQLALWASSISRP